MGTITTKYSIGDVVFKAAMLTKKMQRDCPDCMGSRKWKALSPAGREYDFECPRCAGSPYNRDLSLEYQQYVPRVDRLTVGSLRADSSAEDEGERVQYMCQETGIGSGTIHYEKTLFATDTEAMAAATAMAATANVETKWIADLYAKTLSLSDYQLSDAVKKGAERDMTNTRVRTQMLFEDLNDCQTMEEVRERLERGLKDRAEEAA
jgi:hypothetical protein